MNLNHLLEPVSLEKPDYVINSDQLFSRNLVINTESSPVNNVSDFDIAILGVPEDRNSWNTGCSLAPNNIRKELYQLYKNNSNLKIVDLGNIISGNTFFDTYAALSWVMSILIENNITVIILGGTQDLTIPLFESYEKNNKNINLSVIDPRIDADIDDLETGKSNTFLNKIVFKNKQSLADFNILGLQEYYINKKVGSELSNLSFEQLRLAEIRQNFNCIEPFLRDSNLVSLDMSAIKQTECGAHYKPSPNGFYGEEICRISRMAGMSDNLNCFALFELNSRFDSNNQSASLAAQIIWYFLEGKALQIREIPDESSNFKKFVVKTEDLEQDLIFYKSLKTQRWWLEVQQLNTKMNHYISCTVEDYNQACNQEVPDRWLKAFHRIN